jgi:hypothetical protein
MENRYGPACRGGTFSNYFIFKISIMPKFAVKMRCIKDGKEKTKYIEAENGFKVIAKAAMKGYRILSVKPA